MLPTAKLESLRARFDEIESMLCEPGVTSDAKRYTQISRERGDLIQLVQAYDRYRKLQKQIADDREALSDPELRDMVMEELPGLEKDLIALEAELSVLLLPTDPNDARNVLLEIRGGTGGEEAALFAADIFRMYSRYAERRGWKLEVMSSSSADAGG